MSINVYTLEQEREWNEVIRSFKDYDVYYLPNYVKAFQIHGDGKPLLLYFHNKDTRAANVVIKRDISKFELFAEAVEPNTYFDITTPYGYGGFLVEGKEYADLLKDYISFCIKENIVCEFVRFHPLLENWKGLENLYEEIYLGDTVFMDTRSEEIIWENMTSKGRNKIRKAWKNGIRIYWGREPELVRSFMELYNATMKKDEAEKYYYFSREFYESILEDLKQNAMWFYAKKEEEIIAIAIFMFCNGKMHYHLSGSKKEYQNLAPSNLMLYEAAAWAANHGYERLHLGGGLGSGRDSLYEFKKAFNRKEDSKFYIGRRIFDSAIYEKLVELRGKLGREPLNEKYFPLYRS